MAGVFSMGLAGVRCSGESEHVEPPRDVARGLPESVYDPARLIEVELRLAPNDWEGLRFDGRSMADLMHGKVAGFDYTYFPATVSVDGREFPLAAACKKGFIGSVSALRPSLRVDLERNQAASVSDGVSRLTLNNDRQDPTHVRQCLSYAVFAAAGIPAPRCNLAHVQVNGLDLGYFSNVEPVRKPFLRRHFSSPDGNLYEGQRGDFTPEALDGMQWQSGTGAADRSDLDAVVRALELPDADVIMALDAVVDLDRFRDFWAVETLLGHWDGYSGNLNNFFAYHDPETDKFVFIPWGTDQAFKGFAPGDTNAEALSVYAAGRISSRLYALEDQRDLYRARLAELTERVWDAPAFVAEAERVAALVGSVPQDAARSLRDYLTRHGGALQRALAGPAETWVERPSSRIASDACTGYEDAVGGTFSTHWGDLENIDPESGSFSLDLSYDGGIASDPFGGAGQDRRAATQSERDTPLVRYLSVIDDTRILLVQLHLPPEEFRPGNYRFHAFETFGSVVGYDVPSDSSSFIGLIGDGSVVFDRASAAEAAPVAGHFSGHFYQSQCLPEPGPSSE